jgi:Fe-S cluster assembly protein SufD
VWAGGPAAPRLVIVNGRFAAELSSMDALPKEVRLMSLREAIDREDETVRTHLARHARHEDQAFTALNTALLDDGAFLEVARGVIVEKPIHIMYVSTRETAPWVANPRNLIVAGESSQLTVVESYIARESGVYFNNVVTEIVAMENAVVDHYKVTRESDKAYHISTLRLDQQRNSQVHSFAGSLGGGLVRQNIHAVFDGEGCDCGLNGLYMVDGTEHVDNHLVVEHAKPHCDSREFFKGILGGKGKGIFSGRIIVRPDAQKTDAKQTNMSLLMSEDAQVESRPQLEIFADDVKCTHGATIGQVNDEAVFYLRSRGLNEEAARGILVHAFASEVLDRVKIEPLRAQLEELVVERLPQSGLLKRIA